jgi:hypothetical protein
MEPIAFGVWLKTRICVSALIGGKTKSSPGRPAMLTT